jgi:putative peptidoglycan lipid II flippase
VVLGLLVRRAWGPQALAGAGRTVGAAVFAVAVAIAVGDVASRSLPEEGLWGSVWAGLVVALLTTAAYLVVMAVADRSGLRELRERGRRRRRGAS